MVKSNSSNNEYELLPLNSAEDVKWFLIGFVSITLITIIGEDELCSVYILRLLALDYTGFFKSRKAMKYFRNWQKQWYCNC